MTNEIIDEFYSLIQDRQIKLDFFVSPDICNVDETIIYKIRKKIYEKISNTFVMKLIGDLVLLTSSFIILL